MNIKKIIIILAFAFVGWVLSAGSIGIGMATTSFENTLIIGIILCPIFFLIVSLVYFKKFHFTTPLQTALIFFAFVVIADFFVAGLLINKSLEMFTNLLETWIPYILIFISTYLTGLFTVRSSNPKP